MFHCFSKNTTSPFSQKIESDDDEKQGYDSSDLESDNERERKRRNQTDLTHVPAISTKGFRPDDTLLGVVEKVEPNFAIVRVPCNAKVLVPKKNVSTVITENKKDSLEGLLYVGQYVCCKLTKVDASEKIVKMEGTILPKEVNEGMEAIQLMKGMIVMGEIASLADYGYTIDIGIPGTKCFAKFNRAEGLEKTYNTLYKHPADQHLPQGFAALVSIESTDGVIQVSMSPSLVAKAKVKDEPMIDMLRAGMLVTATCDKVFPDSGIVVTVLEMFTGVIDNLNVTMPLGCYDTPFEKQLVPDWTKSEFTAKYTAFKTSSTEDATPEDYMKSIPQLVEGQKIVGRIIYVNPHNHYLRLTMLNHLAGLKNFEFPEEIAQRNIIEAHVVGHQKQYGVLMNSVGIIPPVRVFVHSSNIADKRPKDIAKALPVSTEPRKCKVIGTHPYDGVVLVSTNEKEFGEGSVTTRAEIKPGQRFTAKITEVNDAEKSITVQLANHIKGVISGAQLADGAVGKPSSRFTVGKTVRCRVLTVGKVIQLTAKKTLVNSLLPAIASLDDAKPGMMAHGFINGTTTGLVFVSFYNRVTGVLTKKNVQANSAEALIRTGAAIAVKVSSINRERNQLMLSLSLEEKPELLAAIAQYHPGQIVSGTISKRTEKGFAVEFGDDGDKVTGFLPTAHLTDHLAHVEKLAAVTKVGDALKRLAILRIDQADDAAKILLTMKPSLVAACEAHKMPSTSDDVVPGALLNGYISHVGTTGVAVSFLGSTHVWVPKAAVADRFVSSPGDFCRVGQSVRVLISSYTHLNKEGEEVKDVHGSMKSSDCTTEDDTFLATFIEEEQRISEHEVASINWKPFLPGKVVKATITEIRDVAIFSKLEGGEISGVTIKAQATDNYAVGDVVDAIVLDLDKAKKIADLSFRPSLVALGASKKGTQAVATTPVTAQVELVKAHYVILSIPQMKLLGIASVRDLNTQLKVDPFALYKVGQMRQGKLVGTVKLGNRYLVNLTATITKSYTPMGESSIKSIDDVKVGSIVKTQVTTVTDTAARVTLGNRVYGRVFISEVWDNVADSTSPLAGFHPGDIIDAKVISVTPPTTELGDSHNRFVELSVRPSELAGKGVEPAPRPTYDTLSEGQQVNAYVYKIEDKYLMTCIAPGVFGRVPILNVSEDIDTLRHLNEHFKFQQGLKCTVISVNPDKRQVELSVIPVPTALKVGENVNALVTGHSWRHGINVHLPTNKNTWIDLVDIDDVYHPNPFIGYPVGTFVKVNVRAMDGNNAVCSLRPSRTGLENQRTEAEPELNDTTPQPEILSRDQIKHDAVLKGFVTKASEKNVFVELGKDICGVVKLSEISDVHVDKTKLAEQYPVGRLVTARVIGLDMGNSMISLSFRKSVLNPVATLKFEDIKVGEFYRAQISKVLPYGIYIRFTGSKVSGFIHVSQVSDAFTTQVDTSAFAKGKSLIVQAIAIKEDKKLVDCTIKPSVIAKSTLKEEKEDDWLVEQKREKDEEKKKEMEEDGESKEESLENKNEETPGEKRKRDEKDAENQSKKKANTATEESDDEREVAEENDSANEDGAAHSTEDLEEEDKGGKDLKLTLDPVEFDFTPLGEEKKTASDDEGMDLEDEDAKPKTRRQKKAEKKKHEKEVEEQEKRQAAQEHPETPMDFERVLLGAPNNSIIWIKFMAHYLSVAEIEKARGVANKALATIAPEMQQDKLNIWMALLNLEHRFGTAQLFQKTLTQALQQNEPKTVYTQLVAALEKDKTAKKLVEDLYNVMIKKFKTCTKVFIRYGSYLLAEDRAEDARRILQVALESLPKHKHIKAIVGFARIEYKQGDAERGRTMFEGIVSSYKKRLDLWSIYIDLELSLLTQESECASASHLRSVFERVTSLPSLSSKKMQFLMKRWLSFEQKYGTAAQQQHVKDKTMEYLERKSK